MASGYPRQWFAIANRVKVVAGWKCEACETPNGPAHLGAVLTVHHLDGDKKNPGGMPREIPHPNLIALCQRCHLRAQHWTNAGEQVSRERAIERLARISAEERSQGSLFA